MENNYIILNSNDWLNRRQIFISASTFKKILRYNVLFQAYEESLASYIYAVRKGKGILITFSGNCGHPSLILHQYLTSSTFFRVGCKVESDALLLTLNGYFTHV